jgi:hypothetical protein
MVNSKSKGESNGDGVNKSEAIREALAEHPQAGPKDIVAGLAAKGIKVSPTLVYYIKSRAKHAKRQQKRARVAAASAGTGTGNPVEVVLRVKDLAREVGGIGNLKMLVDLLAE